MRCRRSHGRLAVTVLGDAHAALAAAGAGAAGASSHRTAQKRRASRFAADVARAPPCPADAALRFRHARLVEARPRSREVLARNRFAMPLQFAATR